MNKSVKMSFVVLSNYAKHCLVILRNLLITLVSMYFSAFMGIAAIRLFVKGDLWHVGALVAMFCAFLGLIFVVVGEKIVCKIITKCGLASVAVSALISPLVVFFVMLLVIFILLILSFFVRQFSAG